MSSKLKLIIKHIFGRDLYICSDRTIKTSYYGSEYGGWALPESAIGKDSIVYSFGIGEDASFDLELISETGCEVHGFDPTPKSLDWIAKNIQEPRFKVFPWALAAIDGELELWLPKNPDHVSASCRPSHQLSHQSILVKCKSLKSLMKELGHDHIDVLKMDIEGAEYDVLKSLIKDEMMDKIHHLLIEFHHWLPSFGRSDTLDAISTLKKAGFEILWVSNSGHELLFGR